MGERVVKVYTRQVMGGVGGWGLGVGGWGLGVGGLVFTSRMRDVQQVMQGLAYLHSMGIIHR